LYRAADDVDKLGKVGRSTARHVALLLIGFDQSEDQITNSDVEIVQARTRNGNWTQRTCSWDDPYRSKGRITLWFWIRDTG
jgi:hypothetical protein